jgi:hypothetical protein
MSTLEGVMESVEIVANSSAGIVNTLSVSMYSFSNTLDTLSEDFESLSNILSNTTARLNQTLASNGIISTNTEAIRTLEDIVDPLQFNFEQFSEAVYNSNNAIITDISSLSNIILEPTNGLSTLMSGLRSDMNTLDGDHDTTYSLAVSLSNAIYDSHTGLSVTLDSNVSHTIRIHETDIPSIDSEISSIWQNLGGNSGSGGGTTYLYQSEFDTFKTNEYIPLSQNVDSKGTQINNIESDITGINSRVTDLDNTLTTTINNKFSSITDIYTVSSGNNMRLSVSYERMYIQKDIGGGNWQNLHIFR